MVPPVVLVMYNRNLKRNRQGSALRTLALIPDSNSGMPWSRRRPREKTMEHLQNFISPMTSQIIDRSRVPELVLDLSIVTANSGGGHYYK